MSANKNLKNQNKKNEVARVFGFLALFLVSALVGVASGIGVTRIVKHLALTTPQKQFKKP
jgi:hypothetical protein